MHLQIQTVRIANKECVLILGVPHCIDINNSSLDHELALEGIFKVTHELILIFVILNAKSVAENLAACQEELQWLDRERLTAQFTRVLISLSSKNFFSFVTIILVNYLLLSLDSVITILIIFWQRLCFINCFNEIYSSLLKHFFWFPRTCFLA